MQERQQQTEDLLDNIRELSRELRLYMTIIDHFIPPEYQVGLRAGWGGELKLVLTPAAPRPGRH